eukprot:6382422-Prymnesium_polylepis.1
MGHGMGHGMSHGQRVTSSAWQPTSLLHQVLKWSEAATKPPAKGAELCNKNLSKALETKAEFTEQEWKQLGVSELTTAHFIRSGDDFFQPAMLVVERKSEKEQEEQVQEEQMAAHARPKGWHLL